jgi:hypothetical protein
VHHVGNAADDLVSGAAVQPGADLVHEQRVARADDDLAGRHAFALATADAAHHVAANHGVSADLRGRRQRSEQDLKTPVSSSWLAFFRSF